MTATWKTAIRWARHHGYTRTSEPLHNGRQLHTWTNGDTQIGVATGGHDLHVHAAGPHFSAELATPDPNLILSVLAGLGILPDRYSAAFSAGRLDGAVDLARILAADLDTYEAVVAAGKAMKP